MKIIVLVVSDTCSVNPKKDTAGFAAKQHILEVIPAATVEIIFIPDCPRAIEQQILFAADIAKIAAIITSGGTGLGPRDRTPDITRKLLHKPAPHLATALVLHGMSRTPLAALSRAEAGVRNQTLIINLPGSHKAVDQYFELLKDILPHALSLISNKVDDIKEAHTNLQNEDPKRCHHQYIEKDNGSNHSNTINKGIHSPATRPRQSTYPLVEINDALRIIGEQMKDWLDQGLVDDIPIDNALGRVSAENIFAKDPLPPFNASIKDGYACISSDGVGVRCVAIAVTAGDTPEKKPLQPGQCARINTGAPLPPGADCVVQVEDTKLVQTTEDGREELEVEILVAPKSGQDVRPAGSDMSIGQLVLGCGERIDAARIGALAGAGQSTVKVRSRPEVAILSTGTELQSAESGPLKEGCVRDSNGPMLRAMLAEQNWKFNDLALVADVRGPLAASMLNALRTNDVLICSGGVSMGEKDLIKSVLENELNADIHFGRTRMKPGKPTTFATCTINGKKKYIFALPGNPVSAYVTFLVFVFGGLRASEGLDVKWPSLKVQVPTPLPALDPRPEFARASVVLTPVPTVKLFSTLCSSCILSSCGSACLVLLPGRDDKPGLDTSGSYVELDAFITHQQNITVI